MRRTPYLAAAGLFADDSLAYEVDASIAAATPRVLAWPLETRYAGESSGG